MEKRENEILTVQDIKQILNISINAAYDLIHSKSFPVIRIGNSFRVPKEPFYLEEDDLVRVKEGMKELGKLPSRAVLVHQKIYKENPQIGAILVAHPVHAMAFAVTDTEFDARTIPESYILLRDVKTLPYEELYLHPDQVATEFDAAHPVVLVENDSVIVTGSSLLQAFDRLEVMELTANSILESQSLGSIVHIRDEEIDDLKTAFHLEG